MKGELTMYITIIAANILLVALSGPLANQIARLKMKRKVKE
ncbi:hypothetical protein AB6T85_21465 [Erwinia sp. ACCC 02193]|uniref:CNNM transmembrane domain-containing protein n=1 Tax=Erwinia aeris TaxID=3239803 RepID=A0ABV4EDI6_9GAMM